MLIFRARRALAGALEQPEKQGKRGRSTAGALETMAAAAQ
jgi:hypothetical protein